ncbi:MAG TPA: reverse transcriptase-like protein [Candidatus Saccharimonadales bacterium]|nr:reverse transcriptase-like protein [Candidatus Saccharimonadales bacterium]
MKTLKFRHRFADAIRKGIKTTTWRVDDTKDISVNDDLELIDQVDPADARSWRVIGTARVEAVVEKRLGDVNETDLQGHESFASREEMLSRYTRIAGRQVGLDTPIKIIHFKLTTADGLAISDVPVTSKITEVKLFADGGSRGNPGPSAAGYAILEMGGRVIASKGEYLGITTNNQAEYQALKLGLEEALRMHAVEVHVFMDSMLVVNQVLGVFKVKNRDLWPVHSDVMGLAKRFTHISFTHVPRELNKLADRAVNDALDLAAKRQ